MPGLREIIKESRAIADFRAGPLIEISFKGRHWDGCGNELIDYVSRTVQELKPAGVVMNLSDFEYTWGNDIGALLFPLFDKQALKFRPFCIIAGGRTALSLKSLFVLTKIPELVNATYFGDARNGIEHLAQTLRRGDTTEAP